MPVVLLASGQLGALGELARRRPGLRPAVDHLGLTGQATDAAATPEVEELAGLAGLPDVSVEVNALPCYSTQPYPWPAMHAHVRRLFDAHGPDRLSWGSELSRLRGSYADLVRLFREELDFLSGPDAEAVTGGSVLAWPA